MRALAAAALLLAACSAPPKPLPDARLVQSSGAAWTPAALAGRPWVADFIFTRCTGPCPALTAVMASLQDRLPERVGLVSVSVDPAHDTPERLAALARRVAARQGRWTFVTGETGVVREWISRGFKLPVAENASEPAGSRVAHTTKLVLVDGGGVVRGYYDGLDSSAVTRLEADALRLLR